MPKKYTKTSNMRKPSATAPAVTWRGTIISPNPKLLMQNPEESTTIYRVPPGMQPSEFTSRIASVVTRQGRRSARYDSFVAFPVNNPSPGNCCHFIVVTVLHASVPPGPRGAKPRTQEQNP